MSETDVEVIVGGNTAFAFDLYRKLREDEGNLFFSPHSISTALAMTYAGARGNTESQMAQTLHFSLDQEQLHPAFASLESRLKAVQERGNIKLAVAHSLWPQIDYAFLEGFISLVKENYGVLISPVNYAQTEAARKKINTWVEKKTEDKIKDLIPPGLIDALTTLVLVNAIYFKGNWARQFDPSLTKGATFWMRPAEGIEVPMMTQQQDFRYAESESVQVLELPYVGGDLSMFVVLPRKVDGLAELENALTAENLEKWTSDLWEREVFVALPVFKMSGKIMLGGTLASMGMTDAFGSNADFSGMDGSKSLFISEVIHQAFIDVNEEGTEAAAATAVVMARSIPPPVPTFRADHPFVFLIRDNNTASILFLGRVVNPLAEAD
ncbi:MAG: serpin family protein [Anaerolineales bacterium]|nr:serpin family protein [Anaerolineales bacterium]